MPNPIISSSAIPDPKGLDTNHAHSASIETLGVLARIVPTQLLLKPLGSWRDYKIRARTRELI